MEAGLEFLHQALEQETIEITELLHRELDEGIERKKARENNYYLSKLILDQPNLTPEDYEKIMSEKHGMVRGSAIHNQLLSANLYTSDRRQRLARIMRKISFSTYSLLTGQSTIPTKDFDETAKIVRSRDFFERRVEGKIFLIALSSLLNKEMVEYSLINASLEKLEEVGRKGSYKLCRETARRLVDIIGSGYKFERKKTSTERVRDILEDVEITRDVEDMRATLIIMQRESQHLKEQFEQEVKNYNDEFIKTFFTRLNSVRSGELLNSIAQTEALINNLKRQGWSMDPELQAIPTIIQIFTNFLRSEGIQPIKNVGEVIEIDNYQRINYEFVGNPKLKPGEQVKVIVKTPGWKFGEVIISNPRVEEYSE